MTTTPASGTATVVLAGAAMGSAAGLIGGGISGGISSLISGGNFIDGFADGALNGVKGSFIRIGYGYLREFADPIIKSTIVGSSTFVTEIIRLMR